MKLYQWFGLQNPETETAHQSIQRQIIGWTVEQLMREMVAHPNCPIDGGRCEAHMIPRVALAQG